MPDKLTDRQEQAVADRGGTLLVSAAAGSGKTRVLIERLMRRMAEGHDIDRFLVITFTKATAAELRLKISKRIAEQINAEPHNGHWPRQLHRIALANISTIHAFCARMLREKAALLDIGMDFRLCDAEEAQQLETQVLDRVLDELYEQNSPDFQALAENTGDIRDDRNLSALILELYRHMRIHPNPRSWLLLQAQQAGLPASQTAWGRYLLQRSARLAAAAARELEDLLRETDENPALYAKARAVLEKERDWAALLAEASGRGWDALRDKALIWEQTRWPVNKKEEAKPLLTRCKALRDLWVSFVKSLRDSMDLSEAQCLEESLDALPIVRGLCQAAALLDESMTAELRRRNLMTFSELEHLALELFSRHGGEIQRRFVEISVDEVQDISALQDKLIAALSEDLGEAMVGINEQEIRLLMSERGE